MFLANKSHTTFQQIATLIKVLLVTNNVLEKKALPFHLTLSQLAALLYVLR